MATTSSKRRSFWQADWFVGLLIVLAVIALHAGTDLLGGLERRFYDHASTSTTRLPSDRIAVIAIDDQSIANLGRWPWPREIHAQLIDLLAQAKAKTIVSTVLFFEPQVDRGLGYIRKIKSMLPPTADGAQAAGLTGELGRVIAEAEAALDSDTKLANSMRNAGDVLVPSVYVLGFPQGNADSPLPTYAQANTVQERGGFSVPAVRGQQPIEKIGAAAAGVAHMNQMRDLDGTLRYEPMLVNYYGSAVPSMALLAAIKSLNLSTRDIRLDVGEAIQIGNLRIRTDEVARMLPQFYPQRDGKPAFAVDSFYDVVSGKIPASKYAGKVVVIGVTAAGAGGQYFTTPGYPNLSSAETMAHMTSSILSEHFIVKPLWGVWVSLAAFLTVALYLVLALPRLSAGLAAAATALVFVALLGTEYALLAGSAFWLELVLPAALLAIGYLGLTTKRFLVTEVGKLRSDEESAETNRQMGIALQSQGQLDMAFDRMRRVPLADDVAGNLYGLALDFERKRQFNKALAVYEHIATYDARYKDLPERTTRARSLADAVVLGGGNAHPGGSLVLTGGSVEKPMLGRYQVERELGKGAMGIVYQGRDPKIGRVVAIKTMALSQEFEGDALNDARDRFFREAETAGRLQHQHIVTIFDAGEEHDLAYIAMEYLKGRDLLDFCRPDHLLPVERVLSIVARVASALDYAHRQNVVHRDIKPANIMYALDTDTVKVTDFGIARITDSSRTKTGMVLGTPSFMSPEQLAGRKVDGRSDLYSLGVMLYQLLAGVLPFRGDSMAELMYKIANEEAEDIRQLRPDLPTQLADVVHRALSKRPETRYQMGQDFANDLLACMPLVALDVTVRLPSTRPPVAPPATVPGATAAAPAAASAAATVVQTQVGAPSAPVPDYDATQELSADLLATYASTVRAHKPATAATPPDGAASETKSQGPDTR